MLMRILVLALLLSPVANYLSATPPNVIFILCDDLGQTDLGCYGQTKIKTPNLDRLAGEGTRFTQAYTGASVCAPARASLMTGLHMGHCPIRANREVQPEGQKPLPEGTFTLAELFRSQGYATACIGKWGLGMFDTAGSPLKRGFQHFYGYNCQRHAHSYFPTFLYRDAERFDLPGNNGKSVGQTYAQNLIADETVNWIKAHQQQPFFLYYAVTLPHGRHEIDDYGQYANEKWTNEQKAFAAMVTRLDRDVQRLVETLQALKLDERTLIIFSGDNGTSFNEGSPNYKFFELDKTGLRGQKRTLYEGGLRQPSFVRWPNTIPAGKVRDEPWAFWDIVPTCAELIGAKLPAGYQTDGQSLVSFFKGEPAPQREYFYWELHEGASLQAVRFEDWKAVKNGPSQPVELYNLKTDHSEQHNVAAEHADLVAKATQLMSTARTDHPDWPLRDKKPAANQPGKSKAK
jgi:arylsulfatase A